MHFTLSILYIFIILTIPCVCLILTPWMSNYQHAPVVPLCLLVSGTKYSLTLLLILTFLSIFFNWDDSHDQFSKILKYNSLCRLSHEISYHVICGEPIYIQFLLIDTVGDEKEMNVDVIGLLAT